MLQVAAFIHVKTISALPNVMVCGAIEVIGAVLHVDKGVADLNFTF